MPMRPDQVVDRAGRDALDVGLLDHRRQRLLGHPPGLQEGREVAALPQLRDRSSTRPGAGLPVAVSVAVALVAARRCARHSRRRSGLGTSSSIRRWAAKPIISRRKVGVGALLQELPKGNPVVGHRGDPRSGLLVSQPNPTQDHHHGRHQYGGDLLHHAQGHDPPVLDLHLP